MSRKEFLKGLKNDVLIEDYYEHTMKRYEYVKHFLAHEMKINGEFINLLPPTTDIEMNLVNYAFDTIKHMYTKDQIPDGV